MKYLLALLAGLLIIDCKAQIIPSENAVLNYRLAGFSVPENKKADSYLFEIAEDSFANENSFTTHVAIKKNSKTNRIIITLPEWGKKYTWRVTYTDSKKQIIKKSELRHFATGTSVYADTSKYKTVLITSKVPNKNLLIFADNTRSLYTIDGELIWYLPEIPGVITATENIRDLKMTPFGTVTFLSGLGAYEIDYNANVLWKAPDDGRVSHDTIERYHHEFTRLHNGHYMVAGNEVVYREIEDLADTALYVQEIKRRPGQPPLKRNQFGTLIEYDSAKNIIWTWRSSAYFDQNYFFPKTEDGRIRANTHLNAFYFDEADSVVYSSYRDQSKIIKVQYPSGKIIACYGMSNNNEHLPGEGYFRAQHNCRIVQQNRLALFNNNVIIRAGRGEAGRISTVVVMKEPDSTHQTLDKVWEFPCNIDTLANACSHGGGSVEQLNDGAFLTGMGEVNRIFIVSKDKKILWNLLLYAKPNDIWMPLSGYRASAIQSPLELQKLVFRQ